ncbi:hypothetical protein Celaphus_00019186 [Cervus elaphus hippelaphus]|uniref:Uncharacterized protein n=1 Tax=Cervus elaphus hippelaphus TaxID=46360 RepID=A0A212C7I9_CEREH|nr:hypothetical protein Celaphus_00019186 [Cervus elaphus hippelaphus]
MEDEKPRPLGLSPPESPRPMRLKTQESMQTRLGDPGRGCRGPCGVNVAVSIANKTYEEREGRIHIEVSAETYGYMTKASEKSGVRAQRHHPALIGWLPWRSSLVCSPLHLLKAMA